ncbi:DUF11 domain-containing protein [Streptomyces sp. NPDC056347]|uniref:DUF11 domain-containing protein n=1 Tax=Streptomyces sp. NPDC056347 TaxID=3345790 RepID=UPI0035E0A89D
MAPGSAPREVHPGDLLVYTLTARNNGPSVARNVTAVDELPRSITFLGSDDGCTADGQTVTCGPEALLAAGSTRTWTFTTRLDPAYLGDGSDLGNVAIIRSDTNDDNSGNNSSPLVVPPGQVVPTADLAITKRAASGTPVSPGSTFDYVLTVSNSGPSQAAGVVVTDTLPAALAFVSSADGCTSTGQNVTCPELATLAVGASRTYTIKVRVSADYRGDGSSIRNVAKVTSDTADPDTSDNTAEAGLPGRPPTRGLADLMVEKTATGPQVAPGETIPYTITVINKGPGDAHQVVVTDRVPAPLTYLSSRPAGCRYDGTTRTVTCPAKDLLKAGDTLSYTLVMRLDAAYRGNGSDAVNTASVTSQDVDPDTANNTSTAPLPYHGRPAKPRRDMAVHAWFAKKSVTPGKTVRLKTRVRNNGPSASSGRGTHTLSLPAGLTFVGKIPPGCRRSSPTKTVCGIPPGLDPHAGRDVIHEFSVRVSPHARAGRVLTGHDHVDEPGDGIRTNDDADFSVRVCRAADGPCSGQTGHPPKGHKPCRAGHPPHSHGQCPRQQHAAHSKHPGH